MPFFTDQLYRRIDVPAETARIISVVPSQTELLFDLGVEEEVIGITKFCVHPDEWFRKKTRIGGTKTLNIEKIKSLRPDLVIANKEENVRGQIEELANYFPVWISDVNNLEDACEMIEAIGTIINKTERAEALIRKIKEGVSQLKPPKTKLRTAYFIWKDPYMTIGGNTFIHDMITKAGLQNIYGHQSRYPQASIDELRSADCQLLLLSSEPYPFKQKHIDELQQHLPGTNIMLVDGEMFSWYGSRLQYAPAYFKTLHLQLTSGQ